MNVYKFSVVIERDADGYFALCPELQGCYTRVILMRRFWITLKMLFTFM